MSNAFKQIVAGTKPLSTDVDQFRQALTGAADFGTLTLFAALPTPATPSPSIISTSGVLNGAYIYVVVDVTGWVGSDGTFYVAGFAPSAQSATVSPVNQQVSVPVATGPSGTIARAIYRTTAGGSSPMFLAWIADNTTTTYTDNIADGSLGNGMPTVGGNAVPSAVPASNTTGTTLGNFARKDLAQTFTAQQSFSDTMFLTKALSTGTKLLDLQQGYAIYSDNVNIAGTSGQRLWTDMPGGADYYVGPRSGTVAGGTADFKFGTFNIVNTSGSAKFTVNTTSGAVSAGSNTINDGTGAMTTAGKHTFSGVASNASDSVMLDLLSSSAGKYAFGMGPTGSVGMINYDSGTAATANYGHKFRVNGTTIMTITGDGLVKINGQPAVVGHFQARVPFYAGNINSTSTTNYAVATTASGYAPFIYHASEWAGNSSMVAEITLYVASGGTAYAGIWDLTSSVAVSGSEVSTTAINGTTLRSSAITLTDGHTYGFYVRTSSASYAANVQAASLVALF